jgi:hypothetical protein
MALICSAVSMCLSGNPGGRPKTKPLSEEIERLLQEKAPEKKGQTWAALIAEACATGSERRRASHCRSGK